MENKIQEDALASPLRVERDSGTYKHINTCVFPSRAGVALPAGKPDSRVIMSNVGVAITATPGSGISVPASAEDFVVDFFFHLVSHNTKAVAHHGCVPVATS